MKIPKGTSRKWALVELACSVDKWRVALLRPWLKDGNLYATDSYVAVRVPVEIDEGDTDGVVPIEALHHARKPRRGKNVPPVSLNSRAITDDGEVLVSVDRPEVTTPDLDSIIEELPTKGVVARFDALKLAQVAKALGTEQVEITLGEKELDPIAVRPYQPIDDRIGMVMGLRIKRN